MPEWITTYGGRKVNLYRPFTVDDIDINDIAHSLSKLCRFAGHTSKFYSVAEHCVHVSNVLVPRSALLGLLHDAGEAYVGDIVGPLKVAMFKNIEKNAMKALFRKYDIKFCQESMDLVKIADKRMLMTEVRDLINTDTDNHEEDWWEAHGEYEPYEEITPQCWLPDKAYEMFMERFLELYGEYKEGR